MHMHAASRNQGVAGNRHFMVEVVVILVMFFAFIEVFLLEVCSFP